MSLQLMEGEGDKQYFSSDVKDCLVDKRHEELISMIKSYGNAASIVDCNGRTLLHLFARFNSVYMTRYLINENVDINAVDVHGEIPLMSATRGRPTRKIWKLLLDAGSDLWNIKNDCGECVMTIVIEKYRFHKSIARMTMDEIEKQIPDIPTVVDVLLGAGYKLYHLDIFKKVEITKLMIKRGCPVNLRDPNNACATALHIAAKENDLASVKLLLQHGADKNLLDSNGLPPVAHNLIRKNHNTKLIKLILPDSKYWAEKSMSLICKCCRKEVLKFLVKRYGINFSKRDESGKSSLHYLLDNKDLGVWEILENVEVDPVCNCCGETPLHEAVLRNHATAMRFLLDAGANVNFLDGTGRSPLLYFSTRRKASRRYPHQECIELLMQAGADAQLVDQNGETIISRLASDSRADISDLIDPILTHLAIAEAIGVKLKPVILSHINNFAKDSFAECRRKIGEMKDKTIFGAVTFIKFLTAGDEKIWKYVRNDDVFKKLSSIRGADYLHRLLTTRFERAVKINRWHSIASRFIGECIQPFIDGNEMVLEIIVTFLSIKQWKMIATSLNDL